VGLKPTRGRVPSPTNISRLIAELVVSRSLRDTAGVLDAVQGATVADLYDCPRPAGLYVDELGRDPGRLRIGLLTDGGGVDIDGECVAAAEKAASLLESMGHGVERVSGDVLFGGDGSVNGMLWMAGLARRVDALAETAGRPATADDVEPYNWTAAQRGKTIGASEWTRAQEVQQAWAVKVFEWLAPYDILLTPTSGCPPLRTEELWPDNERPWRMGHTYGRIGRFTLPFNVTGHPAISLPLHWTADGLPVGVHLVAGMGREDLLFRLSARLEEALPWAGRRPPSFE
jgi:amidase